MWLTEINHDSSNGFHRISIDVVIQTWMTLLSPQRVGKVLPLVLILRRRGYEERVQVLCLLKWSRFSWTCTTLNAHPSLFFHRDISPVLFSIHVKYGSATSSCAFKFPRVLYTNTKRPKIIGSIILDGEITLQVWQFVHLPRFFLPN